MVPYAAYSLGVAVVEGKEACALQGRKQCFFTALKNMLFSFGGAPDTA